MPDERTLQQRQEDWADHFQPMHPIPPAEPNPAGNVAQRRFPRWLAVGLGVVALVYLLLPPLDVLVMGVDARPGEGYVTRTDSIMLVGVQPRRLRLNLLSIPRDLFINVPGYGSQRVNTINMLGEMEAAGTGPALLSAAIEASFGVQPDRYIRLNFDAFVQLVDAVGGVRVNVPKAIVDYNYPTADYGTMTVQFEPGWQLMDGERALIYARTRHADDDYGRAARQQQVLAALARRLANPFRWGAALVALNRNVDTNMNPLEMILYAPPTLVSGLNMNRLVIDRDYITGGTRGTIPDYEKLAPWVGPRFD